MPVMESQVAKKMGHEMETGVTYAFIGWILTILHDPKYLVPGDVALRV